MTSRFPDLSPEKLSEYRQVALRRQKARIVKAKSRREKDWELARKAAKLLREEYRAGRIVVFGSLLHESRFTEWSDVDIAAWGIPSELTFKAIGAVMDLDPSIEVNLVDVNTCPESLLKNIQTDGIDL
ncbi:MAG: nucleotidyltransferase domain-containing protein [Chloroflexota bacterium]